MKRLRKWLDRRTARAAGVRGVAERALKAHEKTFKDLARYNRGELDTRPVSR